MAPSRRRLSHAAYIVKLEEIDRSILLDKKIPLRLDQSESLGGHNQTGSDVWERMLGDEGECRVCE